MGRTLIICAGLFVLLIAITIFASLVGSQSLPLRSSLCALTGASGCGLSPEQHAILFDLRLPRILLAGVVGMCLAAAGAAYQGSKWSQDFSFYEFDFDRQQHKTYQPSFIID